MDNIKVNISQNDIDYISNKVKDYLSDRRYIHTLSVADEAQALGTIFIPERINELKVAALLHDVTKNLTDDAQLKYCNDFGIILDDYQICSPDVLHAITGADFAKRNFTGYVNDEIISAIRFHTTGHDRMTIFEAIIYLADYIEKTRKHDSCRMLRQYFYEHIEKASDKLEILYKTMIMSFDFTVRYLADNQKYIDSDTILARNWFIYLLNHSNLHDR